MWMLKGSPAEWMERSRIPSEPYPAEVKPTAWPVPYSRPRRDGIWRRHDGNR